jgi:hypothetical protein
MRGDGRDDVTVGTWTQKRTKRDLTKPGQNKQTLLPMEINETSNTHTVRYFPSDECFWPASVSRTGLARPKLARR